MSEEFVSGCIQHRDTRHLRLYYDYMDIYGDNEYKAKIIRILETWTDHKRTEWYKTNSDRLEQGQEVLEPDFWITMSYQQFRRAMRHTASEDTLKKALVELEQAKHIKRRINPDFPYGPPQYLLNAKVIQAALNKLSTPPLVPELPPQEDTPPPGKNIPPQEITPTQGVELPLPRGVKTGEGGRKNTPTLGGKIGTSNITTKNHLEDVIDSDKEESTGEQTNTTTSAPSLSLDAAPSSSPQSETFALPDGDYIVIERLPSGGQKIRRASGKPIGELIPIGMDTSEGLQNLVTVDAVLSQIDTSSQQQAIARTCDTCGRPQTQTDCPWCMTTRLPAIPKPAPGPTSHEQNRDASPGNVAVEVGPGAVASAPIPPVPSGSSLPRTMRATVVSPDGPQLSVVPQKGRRGKKVEQDKPAVIPKCDTREIQRRINTHRGYALEEDVDIIRERKAIKTWCNLHTLEDYSAVMEALKRDKYWGKDENHYRIGGLTLLKETSRCLSGREQTVGSSTNGQGRTQQWRSSFDDPTYDMSSEFYPSEAERSKPRAAAK